MGVTSMSISSDGGKGVPSRVLEFAPVCRQVAWLQVAMYIISFGLTWYRIWWDTTLGLFVALWGLYALWDKSNVNVKTSQVNLFHYGQVASLTSHCVALGVVVYYLLESQLVEHVLKVGRFVHVFDSLTFYILLTVVLILEGIVTVFAVMKSFSLCAELSRNDLYFDLIRPNSNRPHLV